MTIPAYLLILTIIWNGSPAMTTIPGEFFDKQACESALARWKVIAKDPHADGYCLYAEDFHGAVEQLIKP